MSVAKKEVMVSAAQAFSDAEQAQGRANIGAASSDGLESTNYTVAQITSALQGKQDAIISAQSAIGNKTYSNPNTSTTDTLFTISVPVGKKIKLTIDGNIQAAQAAGTTNSYVFVVLSAGGESHGVFGCRTITDVYNTTEAPFSRSFLYDNTSGTAEYSLSLAVAGITGFTGDITLRELSVIYEIY